MVTERSLTVKSQLSLIRKPCTICASTNVHAYPDWAKRETWWGIVKSCGGEVNIKPKSSGLGASPLHESSWWNNGTIQTPQPRPNIHCALLLTSSAFFVAVSIRSFLPSIASSYRQSAARVLKPPKLLRHGERVSTKVEFPQQNICGFR